MITKTKPDNNIIGLIDELKSNPFEINLRKILSDAYSDNNQEVMSLWQKGLIRVINKEVSSEELIKEFKSIKMEMFEDLASVDSPFMLQFLKWWISKKSRKPSKAFKGAVRTGYLYMISQSNIISGFFLLHPSLLKDWHFINQYKEDRLFFSSIASSEISPEIMVNSPRHLVTSYPNKENIYLQGMDKKGLCAIRMIPF